MLVVPAAAHGITPQYLAQLAACLLLLLLCCICACQVRISVWDLEGTLLLNQIVYANSGGARLFLKVRVRPGARQQYLQQCITACCSRSRRSSVDVLVSPLLLRLQDNACCSALSRACSRGYRRAAPSCWLCWGTWSLVAQPTFLSPGTPPAPATPAR